MQSKLPAASSVTNALQSQRGDQQLLAVQALYGAGADKLCGVGPGQDVRLVTSHCRRGCHRVKTTCPCGPIVWRHGGRLRERNSPTAQCGLQ